MYGFSYHVVHADRAMSIPMRADFLRFMTRGKDKNIVGDNKPTCINRQSGSQKGHGTPAPMSRRVAEMTREELSRPTMALPGTNRKIDIMTARAAHGLSIFLPGDARLA